MKILYLILLICVTSSFPTYFLQAEDRIVLSPATGQHKFPFFDNATPVLQYNKQTPGPLIKRKVGSKLNVHLINELSEPTTIHWHGLRIDNKMDGVPGVTQEPVNPGEDFLYSLELSEAGTYWYHPHFNNSEQIERGLKGVIVVADEVELPWSRDTVWLLDDWLLQQDGIIYPEFNTPRDLMHDGRWGNVVTINAEYKPKYKVRPGERIRLRLVNGANARIFALDFQDLSAHVIAVDGRPVSHIFPFDNFNLSPGNRVDLDIVIPQDAGGMTYMVMDTFPRKPNPLATITVVSEPAISTPHFDPVVIKNFIPEELFKNIHVTKIWDLNAFRGGKLGIGWGMNSQFWPDSDTAELKIGEPIKIQFNNSSSRLHPMHIHGVFFRVLERNGKPAVEPFTRDTVLIGPKENIVIGMVPEHPGIWATHCHILEHAEAGMMTTISVDSPSSNEL